MARDMQDHDKGRTMTTEKVKSAGLKGIDNKMREATAFIANILQYDAISACKSRNRVLQ
jgi:hypothetical protein